VAALIGICRITGINLQIISTQKAFRNTAGFFYISQNSNSFLFSMMKYLERFSII